MKKLWIACLAALFSFSAVAMHADDLADRKALMKSVNGHMKALNALKSNFNGEAAAKEASEVIAIMEEAQNLFAEKGEGETKALDSIWSDAGGFAESFATNISAANALKAAGESNDEGAFGAAFGQLGQSCGGCHRNFRAKR